MMDATTQQPILVLGGTGKTGRRVVQCLQARGRPVRIGTPSSAPWFDWNDPAIGPSVLDGVGSVYLSYYPDLAVVTPAFMTALFGTAVAVGSVRRRRPGTPHRCAAPSAKLRQRSAAGGKLPVVGGCRRTTSRVGLGTT